MCVYARFGKCRCQSIQWTEALYTETWYIALIIYNKSIIALARHCENNGSVSPFRVTLELRLLWTKNCLCLTSHFPYYFLFVCLIRWGISKPYHWSSICAHWMSTILVSLLDKTMVKSICFVVCPPIMITDLHYRSSYMYM